MKKIMSKRQLRKWQEDKKKNIKLVIFAVIFLGAVLLSGSVVMAYMNSH